MAAHDGALAIAVANDDAQLRTLTLHAHDRDMAADVDAVARERVEHDVRAFRIFARERLRRFQHGDRGPETAKRLRKLETDRPAADDDEVLRQSSEIEYRLVRQVRHRVKSGDGRKRRRRSSRNHETARFDLEAVAGHDR